MLQLEKSRIFELRQCLLDWFQTHRRSLPWRSNRTCYGTWVAEIMLQQTTVATVVPYWHRFMAAFPDIQTLAAASIEDVLRLWQGLGYYRRARQLHQAARLVAENGGQFPQTRDLWSQLPGVGPYTSGAIASQAQNQPVPAVDANARRVLTRWLVDDAAQLPHLTEKLLERIATELVPEEHPGSWNEAVMELGALVCRAARADCDRCPVLHLCRAGLAGLTAEIPGRKPRAARVQKVDVAVFVVQTKLGLWLVPASSPVCLRYCQEVAPVREDFSDLHQGLWGLPSTIWVEADVGLETSGVQFLPSFSHGLANLGFSTKQLHHVQTSPVGQFEHAITRYRLRVSVHFLKLTGGNEPVVPVKDIDQPPVRSYPLDKEFFNSSLKKDDLGLFIGETGSQALSGLARKALALAQPYQTI